MNPRLLTISKPVTYTCWSQSRLSEQLNDTRPRLHSEPFVVGLWTTSFGKSKLINENWKMAFWLVHDKTAAPVGANDVTVPLLNNVKHVRHFQWGKKMDCVHHFPPLRVVFHSWSRTSPIQTRVNSNAYLIPTTPDLNRLSLNWLFTHVNDEGTKPT